MPSQRFLLGTSLAILLVISAASIGLDLKSQSDKASVDHAVEVLKKIADMRLLIRRAESAARGFALTGNPNLAKEYNEASDAIPPAFENCSRPSRGNPAKPSCSRKPAPWWSAGLRPAPS